MVEPLKISPDWYDEPTIVAASGPSLTPEVARKCRAARWERQWRVMAVNDAYKLMPWADALYAADESWWETNAGAPEFMGQRWSCQLQGYEVTRDKDEAWQAKFSGVRLVAARPGEDFSEDLRFINYGEPEHSGFQAINLALLLGAKQIVLVGFDYRTVDGKAHFFGDHPASMRQFGDSAYADMAKAFDKVSLPQVPIVNATPGSRLTRFGCETLDEALCGDGRLHRDRTESHTRSD